MDGDCHSIDSIREAIQCLQKQRGSDVATTVFAPPQRYQNKKWMEFLKEDGIDFRPIHRGTKLLSEPNDKAILKEMRKMSAAPSVCIALLIQDTDFIEAILHIINARGSDNIVVLIPANKLGVIQAYKKQKVKVLEISQDQSPRSRVNAILHHDGSGSVELTEPHEPLSPETFVSVYKEVAMFFQNLGYEASDTHYIQTCAKFWFANRRGSLTVFPSQKALLAVHEVSASECALRKDWAEDTKNLAYFLPITSRSSRTKSIKTYGYRLAGSVFKGGGPFILSDSSDLVPCALRRLRYLDDALNTDMPEAMFLFMNSTANKGRLRKSGWLPRPSDERLDVDGNLRKAFVSNATTGMWQVADNSPNAMEPVLTVLKRAKVISFHSKYSKEEMFEAMNLFVRQQQLPSMRTFNGLRWSILRHTANASDPSMRSVVDFDR